MNTIDSIFISHGAPTFATEPGAAGKALGLLGRQLIAQNARALIVASPHWRSARLAVTSNRAPMIVHDFHGFPKPLYDLKPEIPGAPELAGQLTDFLNDRAMNVELRPQQGFDHGAWVPYLHLFPNGGPPMLQLSMPVDWTGQSAFETGAILGEFARAHGAVVVGSGSLTHNFNDMDMRSAKAGNTGDSDGLPYVQEFNEWIQQQLAAGNFWAIARAEYDAPHFARAHPDDDHYLPLPFALGAASREARLEALPDDVRYSALSMQSFAFVRDQG